MRSLFLKVGATLLTVAATAVSAIYVTAHLKNPNAPLQPAVLRSASGGQVQTLGGNVVIGPSVTPSNVQPITSTYAS